jgi:thiol-disulfide isomerase/thioredoxin
MRFSRSLAPLAPLYLLVALACTPSADEVVEVDPAALVGEWRAVLTSPGGELPFGLRIDSDGNGLSASALNGPEVAPFSGVTLDGSRVVLEFSWYDSRIEAELDASGDRMSGLWTKTIPDGVTEMPFEATRGATPRFLPRAHEGVEPGDEAAPERVAGVWEAVFVDEDGSEPARGELTQDGGRIDGTFLTPTGDYRFLQGAYEDGLMRLSTFDGAHAFLFHARALADGSLEGDFWSRETYHATWTATPGDAAANNVPDAWELVGLNNDEGRLEFSFPDLEGQPVALSDSRFQDKVVLVNIFGSWCPNCNDEAPLLAAWAREYRDRGLEVVGLAYEFSGDPDRDREMVRRFGERYDIDYPLLVAGVSDKQEAASTLPDLTSVVAYPTTVFVDRSGSVRKIHSGFSGPGTGAHYDELVVEMEGLIEELLAEAR